MNAPSASSIEKAVPGERRSPVRRGSRGDKHRVSPAIIVNMVQASDLLLLLLSGWLASSMLTALRPLDAGGPLLLATVSGGLVAAVFLSRGGAYELFSLRSLGGQLKLLPLPLLAGGGSIIVCLFLMRDDALAFREWPFFWLLLS